MRESILNFVGLEKTVIGLATGCLRTMKICYICIKLLKRYFYLGIKIWDSAYQAAANNS